MATQDSRVAVIRRSEEERGRSVDDPQREILLIFDVHIKKKYGLQKPHVANLTVDRTQPARLRDLTEHLESQLLLPGGHGRRLLLQAICSRGSLLSNGNSTRDVWIVPLVCDQMWDVVLKRYPLSRLKILVNQNRSLVLTHNRSCREWLFGRDVRIIDIKRYLPTKNLEASNIMDLCNAIFERRLKVKPHLRKGVWMHLVGVFPPELKSREQRIQYVEQLRMIYDSLKGKWKGEQGERSTQVQHLVEAIHRDAVRTDPTHPFYTTTARTATESLSPDSISNTTEESNIQKLVNILTIYILEHDDLSYTQGMTDLLSPFLYVMNREADAYICFAAMVERIKSHFNTWCVGTLLKIERLRHICEVLDPELYHFLTTQIEEDAFALFFGMVLIECRREFSFDDSFHLFEATWAGVACMKNSLSQPTTGTRSDWAHFMTYQSREVIQQVFGETQSPYSAHPLPSSYSNGGGAHLSFSRHSSLLSQTSIDNERNLNHQTQSAGPNMNDDEEPSPEMSINHSDDVQQNPLIHSSGIPQGTHGTTTATIEDDGTVDISDFRPRSYTDPSWPVGDKQNEVPPRRCASRPPPRASLSPPLSLSQSHSENELYDSFSYNKVSAMLEKTPAEMADLSSVSSCTISSTNGNGSEKSTKRSVSSNEGRKKSSDYPAESAEVSIVNHNTLSTPEPDFKTPTDFLDVHKDLQSGTGQVTSSSGYSSNKKGQSSPYSTSPSSMYITATEESSPDQSSNSQSPIQSRRSRQRRVVKKGERITTESVPDDADIHTDHTSNQSTPMRQPHVGGYSHSYTTPNKMELAGQYSRDGERNNTRITPVQFFDTVERIASSAPGTATNSGLFSVGGNEDDNVFMSAVQRNMRANSDVSLIMSQLVSTEQALPRVTRESSLEIPLSDCFPLFVCMAILSQHRARIMQRNIDFAGLSQILNSQAGQQDVDKTLYIARDLYRIYRGYQASYSGVDPDALNTWLDDDRHQVQGHDQMEEHTESGVYRQNSMDSDSVFNGD